MQLKRTILATCTFAGLVVILTALAIAGAVHPHVRTQGKDLSTSSRTIRAQNQPASTDTSAAPAQTREVEMEEIPASITVYPARADARAKEEDSGQTGDDGLKGMLQRWSTAMVNNDPHAEAAEYAPHMDRYFLKSNVDHAFVETDKREYLRRGNYTADFTLRDVVIESKTDATADVRLVKDVTWRRAGGATHKLIRSRLHLQKFLDGWKITGEQDFK